MGGGMGGFFNVQDDVFGSGAGLPSGTGRHSPTETSGHITMMDLTRVIVAVVAPETWSENGDGDGELQVLGTALVVRQSPAVHKQIEDLLDQLRKGSGKRKTVAIDARWLLLNSDDLEKLTTSDTEGNTQVDPTVLAEYTRRPSSIRGLINCFSGQLVFLVSGTRQSVVTSVVPVVGSVGKPAAVWCSVRLRAIPRTTTSCSQRKPATPVSVAAARVVPTWSKPVSVVWVISRWSRGPTSELCWRSAPR